jgi:hypothetical protein
MSSAPVTRFVRAYICSLVKEQFSFPFAEISAGFSRKTASHLALFGFCNGRNVRNFQTSINLHDHIRTCRKRLGDPSLHAQS